MAFTAEEIEAASPGAWTGKAGALIYRDPATVAAFLSRRGKTAFSGSNADDQEVALIRATEAAENAISGRVRGIRLNPGQRLLFPGEGYYDHQGRLLDTNEAPEQYLDGIAYLAEEIRAGTYLLHAAPRGISSERTRTGGVEYRQGSDPSSLAENHPEIWNLLRSAIPRMY